MVYARITLCCDYEHINLLHYHLPAYQAKIVQEEFLNRITYTLELPVQQNDTFIQTVKNASNGKIQIKNQIILDS